VSFGHSGPKRLRPPRVWPRLLGAFGLVLVALIWDLHSGPASIGFSELLALVTGQTPADSNLGAIFIDFRLPRVMTAIFAGALLPVAGALMQALFRNPLASPSELGVSAGASLGVALLVLGIQGGAGGALVSQHLGALSGAAAIWGTVGAAFVGSMAVLLILLVFSARARQTGTLLIAGLLLTQWISALIGLMQWMSGAESLRAFTFWGLGSLSAVDMPRLKVMVPWGCITMVLALFCAKPLDALALGEDSARALGVSVKSLRVFLLLIAGSMTAMVTAFCGPIAFVALMVPHMARALMQRTAHGAVLPACMLLGAALMLFCDALTQWPGQGGVLPINALTALMGAPVILMVVLRKERFA
jgi:iron complex transport system permease protein